LDAISPGFAENCAAKLFQLNKPVKVGLGCKGSKSMINFGTYVRTRVAEFDHEWYYDVSNIAHYNAIVGMPFCSQHKVTIDVENRRIYMDGNELPVVEEGKRLVGTSEDKSKPMNKKWRAPPAAIRSFRSFRDKEN
jgi:hypothetical protein